MEYKISVVIPFYNCEKCIKRAIDSVLNQNRNDVLIILSDDGSTDKSIKICEEYVQKYQNIKLIKAANSGPSGARNRGIDAAEGDYIIFLDADDETAVFELNWDNQQLAKLVEEKQQNETDVYLPYPSY